MIVTRCKDCGSTKPIIIKSVEFGIRCQKCFDKYYDTIHKCNWCHKPIKECDRRISVYNDMPEAVKQKQTNHYHMKCFYYQEYYPLGKVWQTSVRHEYAGEFTTLYTSEYMSKCRSLARLDTRMSIRTQEGKQK
jgi:hypothetical protein